MNAVNAIHDDANSVLVGEFEVDHQQALKEFNQILEGRRAFNAGWSQDWGDLQWREAISATQVGDGLRGLTLVSGAAVLLVKTWNLLGERQQAELSGTIFGNGELLFSLHKALDALLGYRNAPISGDQLDERLDIYVQAAGQALRESAAVRSDDVDVIVETTIPMPMSAGVGTATCVQRLWEQVRGLDDLVNAIGRQPDKQSRWNVWYERRWESVNQGIPALAEYAAWAGTKKIINKFLDVGLLPIMGHNIITFGKSVVAPWMALREFSTYMVVQSMLYDLHDYGVKVMKLREDSRLMRSVRVVIDQIDTKAVRYAFKVTPFGLVVSIYEAGEWLGKKLTSDQLEDAATVVINHATRSGDTEMSKKEQHFARMVVMALMPPQRDKHEPSQDPEVSYYFDYIRTMTEFEEQARKDLASRMKSPKKPSELPAKGN